MAKRKISNIHSARKRTVHKREQKTSDRDLVAQWRVLKKLGVYDTRVNPSADRLSAERKKEIKKRFNKLQSMTSYRSGETYRPVHRDETPKQVVVRDALGRTKKVYTRQAVKYVVDTDHFQIAKGKIKKAPRGMLKTSKGVFAPKAPDEKISITKDGKVKVTEKKGGPTVEFTREPLTGPVEIIKLVDDIKSGRLKMKKKEGIRLRMNGDFQGQFYPGDSLHLLVQRLEKYIGGFLWHGHGGQRGDFDDWANNAELIKATR